jgi:hypothetical protein
MAGLPSQHVSRHCNPRRAIATRGASTKPLARHCSRNHVIATWVTSSQLVIRYLKVRRASPAKVTERHKKSIYSVLSNKAKFAKRGAKEKLQGKDVTHIVQVLRKMVREAKARWEVTLAMLKKRARCKLDDKVVRKALKKKNIKFRRMRSKPILTKEDRIARFKFAKKYRGKTKAWWLKHINLHIDLKNFPVYTSSKARDFAAMREVRGAYRTLGRRLQIDHTLLAPRPEDR